MLQQTHKDLEGWRTYLKEGWYDYKSPAVDQNLITLWQGLLEELNARFPDLEMFIAAASDSSIGMDIEKRLESGKLSEDCAIVWTDTVEEMELYNSVSGEEVTVPFDKEVLFKFIENFRGMITK